MASEEYSKLYTEDAESLSTNHEVAHHYLCQKCSADIDEVIGVYKGRKLFGRVSCFQTLVFILLLTANLGTVGLWWQTTPQVTDCLRPLLTYCEVDPSMMNGAGD